MQSASIITLVLGRGVRYSQVLELRRILGSPSVSKMQWLLASGDAGQVGTEAVRAEWHARLESLVTEFKRLETCVREDAVLIGWLAGPFHPPACLLALQCTHWFLNGRVLVLPTGRSVAKFATVQQNVSETWEQLAAYTIQDFRAVHISASSILRRLDAGVLPFLR